MSSDHRRVRMEPTPPSVHAHGTGVHDVQPRIPNFAPRDMPGYAAPTQSSSSKTRSTTEAQEYRPREHRSQERGGHHSQERNHRSKERDHRSKDRENRSRENRSKSREKSRSREKKSEDHRHQVRSRPFQLCYLQTRQVLRQQ